MSYVPETRDRQDPNHWDALYFDQGIPVDPVAKAYMVKDLQCWSRNYLLIPIKVFANLCMGLIMTGKRLLPFQFRSYWLMHHMAVWFLKTFATPEACYLILRHMSIGSNIVNFLIDNGPDPTLPHASLYPKRVEDLADNAFLEHDIVLYNFVLDYHEAQQRNPHWLDEVQQRGLNFGSVRPFEIAVDVTQRGWLQVLDMESALELFKICYSLCVTSREFQRAVLSLQFDESFAQYFSQLTNDYRWNHVVTNRHPLAPNSPFAAARDLLLHGVLSEYLHRYLELAAVEAAKPEQPPIAKPAKQVPQSTPRRHRYKHSL